MSKLSLGAHSEAEIDRIPDADLTRLLAAHDVWLASDGAAGEQFDRPAANLIYAGFFQANLQRANLPGAFLYRANLRECDFAGANLANANLEGASMVNSVFHQSRGRFRADRTHRCRLSRGKFTER